MKLIDRLVTPSEIKKFDIQELNALAKEVRQLILDTVLENGGHLASSLGAVEVILAMHYVFNPPNDKFIFDVGHQSYAHKIITGRANQFKTLRLINGLSGFPKRSESIYDCFDTGHSSTAISAGTGFAKAAELKGESLNVVSLVGDGALTGGLSYEALNYSNSAKIRQVIILNDNSMSIGKNVGHMANYLLKLHNNSLYRTAKKNIGELYKKLSLKPDEKDDKFLSKFKNSIKYFIQSGLPFEQYGYKYFGPIDGHNFQDLIQAFEIAAMESDNCIIHVVTQKGHGYLDAEQNPDIYHGYSCHKYDCCEGENFSKNCGNALLELAKNDSRIVALTAAMADGTGLKDFQKELPDRLIDVGIAEAQAACMSAALALEGLKPYFAVYSSFLQRAYDQVLHDIALQSAPVRLLIDRAGIVPDDGETHQGIYDVALLRSIPNMIIAQPKDTLELRKMLEWSVDIEKPLAIRYPKGCFKNIEQIKDETIKLGKWETLASGKDATIIASGALMIKVAIKAANLLKEKGVSVSIVNARFVKPLDESLLSKLKGKVFTLEDNQFCGGFGSAVSEFFIKNKISADLEICAIEEDFLTQGKVWQLLKHCKLDAESIAERVENAIR